MVVIDKAILHILDFGQEDAVYSSALLDMELSCVEFLVKHIEKTAASQDAKKGEFYEDSEFKKLLGAYLDESIDFVQLSQEIARILYKAISKSEEAQTADVFVVEARVDDVRQLVVFKCNNHQGYVHQVSCDEEGRIVTNLINNYAILPGINQKIDEFVFVSLDTMELSVKSRKYTVDGSSILLLPELLLECAQSPSPSETIKEITKAVKKVTDAFAQDQVATAAAVKNFISENIEAESTLDPIAVGQQVFQGNPSMQAEYSKEIEEAGFSEPIAVNQEATLKKMRKHKLSTDTGIEITIPTDYFEDTEFIEFFKNDDGTMTITLKNIQNLTNR